MGSQQTALEILTNLCSTGEDEQWQNTDRLNLFLCIKILIRILCIHIIYIIYICIYIYKSCEDQITSYEALIRAGEPANFLAAPAPDFFFKRLRLLIFFPSGSGSWFFFRAAPAPRIQKQPAPTGSGSLAKYSFSKLVR